MDTLESPQEVSSRPGQVEPFRARYVVLFFVNFAFLAVGIWAYSSFGSIQDWAGYYLRGETLFVDSREKTFRSVAPGERTDVRFKLTNRGTQPMRVLGCYSRCGCLVPNDLPLSIGCNESRDFDLTLVIPKNATAATAFSRLELVLFTNNPSQYRIPLVIRGEIRPKAIETEPKS